jgi:hypothetical protein
MMSKSTIATIVSIKLEPCLDILNSVKSQRVEGQKSGLPLVQIVETVKSVKVIVCLRQIQLWRKLVVGYFAF